MAKFPTGLFLVNSDNHQNIIDVLNRQLFIDSSMDGYSFINLYIDTDPNILLKDKNSKRILVIADLSTYNTYKSYFDVVMFIKNGLVNIEKNNFGPSNYQTPLDNLSIYKILRNNNLIT